MKILLSGGTIYPFEDSQRYIPKGYLGIDETQILFVSEEKPRNFPADRIVNCQECLIIPGFVNCHTHLAENVFKGLMDEVDFEGIFYTTLFRWEAQLDPEMVYWGSLAGALDALRCGVTTVADMYHYASSTAKAVSEAGLRAYIGQKILGFSLSTGVMELMIASMPLNASSSMSRFFMAFPTPGIMVARSFILPIFLICCNCDMKSVKSN